MRVGVDVGGTFTDLVAVDAKGTIVVRKVASTPQDPAAALFRAVGALGERGTEAIDVLIHGTTVATNALLERRGARVALLATAGFEDLLWLRRQSRADLYDLSADHPPPVVARSDVFGVAERMGPDGVVTPLADAEVARLVHRLVTLTPAPEAIAIALLFAFRYADHERRLAAALRAALPGVPVVASHEVVPAFREYERTGTTVAEAYLRPRVSAYLTRASADRPAHVRWLRIMTSSGGTLAPETACCRATSLALSGPAGGVVGARLVGEATGWADLLTLDMGGTSADASIVIGGEPASQAAANIGGVPVALPAVLIETVSAGGGSIAWVDAGGALRVGPRSAGAVPGPASYGRGGTEPTVTDACLVLGWLDPEHPLADDVRLDRGAAERAIAGLTRKLSAGLTPITAAAGIVAVTAAGMARALKRVSVARGVDPRRLSLLAFGGAGPLFGCALAETLGMRRVIVPPHPGALSALGLASAGERIDFATSLHRPLSGLDAESLGAAFGPLEERATQELPGAKLRRQADCRFAGQGYEITVPVVALDPVRLTRAFLDLHQTRYGFGGESDDGRIEVVNLRVVAERAVPRLRLDGAPLHHRSADPATPSRRPVVVEGEEAMAAVWPLDGLPAGCTIAGPAILAGQDATGLIAPGWQGAAHASGAVILERL